MKQEIIDAVIKFKSTNETPKLASRFAEYRFKAHYNGPEWHVHEGNLYHNNRQVVAEDNDKLRAEILQKLYDDPATTCSGRDRFYPRVAENYLGITKSDVMKFLASQETYQLHKQVYHQRAVKPVIALNPAKYLQVDLIDLSDTAYWNGNNRYIMTVIDVFSKRAWAVPMKTRTGPSAAKAIDPILAEVKPRVLQSDNGSEFIAAEFGAVCDKYGTKQIFSKSHTPQSQGQIEKFNRTLKSMLSSHFTQFQTRNWTNVLAAKLDNYNSTVHTTTKARPDDLFNSPSNELKAQARSGIRAQAGKALGYNVRHFHEVIGQGTKVRIANRYLDPEARKAGVKKYHQQWSNTQYTVARVIRGGQFENRKVVVEELPGQQIPVDCIQVIEAVESRELALRNEYRSDREIHLENLHASRFHQVGAKK